MLSLISGSSDAAREAELRRTAFSSGRGRLQHWKPSSKPIMHCTVSHTFFITHIHTICRFSRTPFNSYCIFATCLSLFSRNQHIHNIAEELDPTFKARKRESQISTSPPSGTCMLYNRKFQKLYLCHISSHFLFPQQVCAWPLVTRTVYFMTIYQNPPSYHQLNGRAIKQDVTKPKTRKRIVNNSERMTNSVLSLSFLFNWINKYCIINFMDTDFIICC